MDVAEFTQQAREDPQLNAFLTEVAEEAGEHISIEEPTSYTVTGVDLLIAVAAYALYRYLKDYFDKRRALNEVEVLKKQEEVIAALIEEGFYPKDAQAVTIALLENIAKRSSDNPAFKKAVGLLG